MIGNLISAGASLIGGLFNKSSADKARDQTQQHAAAQMAAQKEFAQNGIRWRVEDAKASGIHPLYALGANTASYAPVSASFQADNSIGNALSNAGQDIGRAVNATRTAPERADAFSKSMQAIALENAGLDLQIKKTQLASSLQRLQANANPPIPEVGPFKVGEANKAEERQPLMLDGERVPTSPGTSPAKAYEDQFGDDIISPGFLPNVYGSAKEAYGPPATWPMQMVKAATAAAMQDVRNEWANAKRLGRAIYNRSVFSGYNGRR